MSLICTICARLDGQKHVAGNDCRQRYQVWSLCSTKRPQRTQLGGWGQTHAACLTVLTVLLVDQMTDDDMGVALSASDVMFCRPNHKMTICHLCLTKCHAFPASLLVSAATLIW